MARRKLEDRMVRKLIKGTTSYLVTLPVDAIRALNWREGQKLDVHFNKRDKELIIRDWQA